MDTYSEMPTSQFVEYVVIFLSALQLLDNSQTRKSFLYVFLVALVVVKFEHWIIDHLLYSISL